MTIWVAIACPDCQSTEVTKHGKSPLGKQRYDCQNTDCPYRTSVLTQTYPGKPREVKQQIVEITLNGSGVRDIARGLHLSPTTVIQELKKLALLKQVNSSTAMSLAHHFESKATELEHH